MRARFISREKREKGVAIAMTAGMLTFIVPAAGLAVDASMLYGVKARLSMSADAAALAAARSLSRGLTIADQESAAIDTARRFLDANFPNGYLYSTNRTSSITVAETGTRTRTVTVDVSVTAPSYFLRFLGRNTNSLRAIGKASRRDVNVMMVLDRSTSLANSGSCPGMKDAAGAFSKKFANYRDRVGLLTYGGDYRVDFPMQTTPGNFLTGTGQIPDLISKINCVGSTNTAQALWMGYEQLKTINEPGSLNIILLFTDGQPTSLTFDFANSMRTVARGYTGSAPSTPSGITTLSKTPCSSGVTGSRIGWVQNEPQSGRTFGVYQHLMTTIPAVNSSLISNRNGCVFNMSNGITYLNGDFGFMPPQDIYGNSVQDAGYKSLLNNTAGPDINKPRINHSETMGNAAINATNDAARRIRSNATSATELNTIIYVIGLGYGNGVDESELLNRIANTPASSIYDSSRQQGLFVYAPSSAQLSEAFSRIAGEILRIAR